MQLRGSMDIQVCGYAARRRTDGYGACGFVVSGGSALSSGFFVFTPYVGRHRVSVP